MTTRFPVHIRDATPADYDGVRSVQRRTWLATYPNAALGITVADILAVFDDPSEEAQQRNEARRRSINATPQTRLWVAETDAGIVGMCLAHNNEQQRHIQALYVLPDYQGQGLGKRLMQAALDWLGDAQPVTLHVAAYNTNAIAFYQHLGFVLGPEPDVADLARLPSGALIPEQVMVRPAAPQG